jgi:hypothetical protein
MQQAYNASVAESPWRRWLLILLGLGLVAGLLYYYFTPKEDKIVKAMFTGPQSLSASSKPILDQAAAITFFGSPEATINGFFYVNKLNRTGEYAEAGSASYADGTFGPCACVGAALNDCTPCKHAGYAPLLSIAGVVTLEVLTAPDASRQGKAMTQLAIKTQGPRPTTAAAGTVDTAKQTYVETIVLPPLPLQKWVMVTIAREARRFDVYYDRALVASKKTLYVPVYTSSDTTSTGIVSGSAKLAGELALVDVESRRFTMSEVAAVYGDKCDTRGTPYVSSQFAAGYRDDAGLLPSHSDSLLGTFGASMPSVSLCPAGGCLDMPAVRPPSPLEEWSTEYA